MTKITLTIEACDASHAAELAELAENPGLLTKLKSQQQTPTVYQPPERLRGRPQVSVSEEPKDANESLFDAEHVQAPQQDPRVDVNGVPFDPEYVSGGSSPTLKNGAWKKRNGVDAEEFKQWYTSRLPPFDVSQINDFSDYVSAVSTALDSSDNRAALQAAFDAEFAQNEGRLSSPDGVAEALRDIYANALRAVNP